MQPFSVVVQPEDRFSHDAAQIKVFHALTVDALLTWSASDHANG